MKTQMGKRKAALIGAGAGLLLIPLAVLLAFSRLYLYVHVPGDVFAGAVLGLVIGELVSRYASKLFQKRG